MSNKFSHIYPNLEDWPIKKLSDKRDIFIAEIDDTSFNRFKKYTNEELRHILRRTAYLELQRIKHHPWNVDPPKEKQFWQKVQRRIEKIDTNEPSTRSEIDHILSVIIDQYAQEIVGKFKISTFKFARRFLTCLFHRIYVGVSGFLLKGIFCSKKRIEKKLHIHGPDLELLRSLEENGTLILLPTHQSNLDSILLGYIIDLKLGLPGFSYGAGLNLYNNAVAAYYMNRLGAYRIDRRKRNMIYLETLKAMSELSIAQGTNSLFFLGGTRIRSGALEENLKLGLLGTTISAQRRIYQEGRADRIFTVPVVISYNFVFEAKSLVEQHLKTVGKESYRKSKNKRWMLYRFFQFIYQLYKTDSEVHVQFGMPRDVFGNRVDGQGQSLDSNGKVINTNLYYMRNDILVEDEQREQVYTKRLSEQIVADYKFYNYILCSQILAYCAFKILEQQEDDMFTVFKLRSQDIHIDPEKLYASVESCINQLKELRNQGKIYQYEDEVDMGVDKLITKGLNQLDSYHQYPLLYLSKYNSYKSEDTILLYYYSNRLSSYELDISTILEANSHKLKPVP